MLLLQHFWYTLCQRSWCLQGGMLYCKCSNSSELPSKLNTREHIYSHPKDHQGLSKSVSCPLDKLVIKSFLSESASGHWKYFSLSQKQFVVVVVVIQHKDRHMFAVISGSSVYFYLPCTVVSICRLQHIHNHIFPAQLVVYEKLATTECNKTEGRNLCCNKLVSLAFQQFDVVRCNDRKINK